MENGIVLRGMNPEVFGRWLSEELAADASVLKAVKLPDDVIRENWAVSCLVDGVECQLVVRCSTSPHVEERHSCHNEFVLLNAIYNAGVRVPRPMAFCDDPLILGSQFVVVSWVDGVGLGSRIVKDMNLGGDRDELVRELGRQLARIHSIRPPCEDLTFLGEPSSDPLRSEIKRMRDTLDILGVNRPALEWGLAQLNDVVLPFSTACLTHRDFRTGNYLVNQTGLTGILGWELAGWGDPMADLGWFCAECWRFGRPDLDAGGVGPRTAFYEGYSLVSGRVVEDRAVRIWEILAHLRWAVISLQRSARYLSGSESSLDLALTGRLAREAELAVMRVTAPGWKD